MIEHNEVIVLVVATGVLFVLWMSREGIRRIPGARLLFSAYVFFYSSWWFTVLEGLFWPNLLNLLEHASAAIAAVLFACWCARLVRSEEGARL